jgi:hypothetical protein
MGSLLDLMRPVWSLFLDMRFNVLFQLVGVTSSSQGRDLVWNGGRLGASCLVVHTLTTVGVSTTFNVCLNCS